MQKKIKYEVNIDIANKTKQEMQKTLQSNNANIISKPNSFAALYDFNFPNYKEPVLVMKTEEPGTKQLLAAKYGSLETIAYDMINHLVNDCIVMGARPLAVQDAIICGKIVQEDVNKLVKAMSNACKEQGCNLVGGETSEQPGVVEEGVYILTSSIVGLVEKSEIIDGTNIKKGDIVLAVASNGIHTNGITMVRSIIKEFPNVLNIKINNETFIQNILRPHMCYYNIVKDLFKGGSIKGMAHITGGGISENLNRILPPTLNAEIDLQKYKVLEVFKIIKKFSNASDEEMLRVFNMGVGLAIVTNENDVNSTISHIKNNGGDCYEIGRIVTGSGEVLHNNDIVW